jgi:hypothetical protein
MSLWLRGPIPAILGQLGGSAFSLNEAQYGALHQLLGVCTGFGSYLRKLRFLLRREMYFHVSRLRNNRVWSNARYPAVSQKGPNVKHGHGHFSNASACCFSWGRVLLHRVPDDFQIHKYSWIATLRMPRICAHGSSG